MSAEGEVERKVRELGDEIFQKYNPDLKQVDEDGKPYITKENLREFIMSIMTQAGEIDAWDEEDFDQGYFQFDKDRSGQIDREEFDSFVKRFADLWVNIKSSDGQSATGSETDHQNCS